MRTHMRRASLLSLLAIALVVATRAAVVIDTTSPPPGGTADVAAWIMRFDGRLTDDAISALRTTLATSGAAVTTVARTEATRTNRTYVRVVSASDPKEAMAMAASASAPGVSMLVEAEQHVSIAALPLFPSPGGVQSSLITAPLDRLDSRGPSFDSRYTYPTRGEAVTVYVLDTGIRADHQEFMSGRATFGANYHGDGIDGDCHGHGTGVASLAVGVSAGTAKGATVVGIKVLGCDGIGSTTGIALGLEHVADTCGADDDIVINMSFGAIGSSTVVSDAVASVRAQCHAVLVAAAGNENMNACYYYPASIAGVVAVGASNAVTDMRASFSNYGSCVDVYAPGVNVRMAGPDSTTHYRSADGTSMASPFVAGIAAMAFDLARNGTFGVTGNRGTAAAQRVVGTASRSRVYEGWGSYQSHVYAGLVGTAPRTSLPLLPLLLSFVILHFMSVSQCQGVCARRLAARSPAVVAVRRLEAEEHGGTGKDVPARVQRRRLRVDEEEGDGDAAAHDGAEERRPKDAASAARRIRGRWRIGNEEGARDKPDADDDERHRHWVR